MEEAERLCDRVVIMDHGQVVASDTLAGLYKRLPAVETLELEVDGAVDLVALGREPGIDAADSRTERGCMPASPTSAAPRRRC